MQDDAAHYQRLLDSRRQRGPCQLSEAPRRISRPGTTPAPASSPLAAIIQAAARQLKRRESATDAWQRVASAELNAQTVVESVDRDTIVIRVNNPTLCYDLTRAQAQWERQLARLVPGVRRVRFRVGGAAPAGGLDAGGPEPRT